MVLPFTAHAADMASLGLSSVLREKLVARLRQEENKAEQTKEKKMAA
jgi:hypothetical protein